MKRARERKSKPVSDLKRLFNWYDTFYILGNFLYRRGVRFAGYTAIFTTGNYLKQISQNGGLSFTDSLK